MPGVIDLRLAPSSAVAAWLRHLSLDACSRIGWVLTKAESVMGRVLTAAETCVCLLSSEGKLTLAKPPQTVLARLKWFARRSLGALLRRACALGAALFYYTRRVTPSDRRPVATCASPTEVQPEPEAEECAECRTRAEVLRYRRKLRRERTQNF
ncbi:uncharacterized protein LOC134541066 [Bacillus rossius redtenbacheri]|uniref:uncharacterized protein LOC134541066 n=1 Tax=Bacillus rossius redtenbacheri TaxID=93214 RepID=UPI002FDECA33